MSQLKLYLTSANHSLLYVVYDNRLENRTHIIFTWNELGGINSCQTAGSSSEVHQEHIDQQKHVASRKSCDQTEHRRPPD